MEKYVIMNLSNYFLKKCERSPEKKCIHNFDMQKELTGKTNKNS